MSSSHAERETMEFDVVIVGGGPAGLAAAIRLKQLAADNNRDVSVCVIEKASEIGAHILSGAVIDPRALDELFPDWKARNAPLNAPVTEDCVLFLTETGGFRIPNMLIPTCLHNAGNYVISLGNLCRWLARQAEELGVEVYPGFAGAGILYDDETATPGVVTGVITGDMGRLKNGDEGSGFQPGMALRAKYTLFAEGSRGHLGKELESRFNLRAGANPQTYAIGIKELWEVRPENHHPGLVIHTGGWPMDNATYGGGFVYHLEKDSNQIAIGFVVGLGYSNPHLSPFEEMQRFKQHPKICPALKDGRRISYGARALSSGGLQSLPKLIFPGGALIGDDAGFLNAARIKGTHCALKSGSLAAEACFAALTAGRANDELVAYPEAFCHSWLHEELHLARNFKPWMNKGFAFGSLMFGLDQHLFRGHAPWTLTHKTADHNKLRPAADCPVIEYPKPDGITTFDRLSSVFLSHTHHVEDQPCHLQLKDPKIPISVNLAQYDAPEQRFCPAGVYEIIRDEHGAHPRLQINPQNCIHCKTCDIKDPTQNINWVTPQGGDGPNYPNM